MEISNFTNQLAVQQILFMDHKTPSGILREARVFCDNETAILIRERCGKVGIVHERNETGISLWV